MKERGKLLNNTVVTTVMSNFGLYKAFDEQGIGYAKTAVGDKYVYEYMAKNGCRIGGEQSGHIIFSKYASTGDGILTSLKMMEVMLAKKKPMSELAVCLANGCHQGRYQSSGLQNSAYHLPTSSVVPNDRVRAKTRTYSQETDIY